ncbi:MAG: PEP-CTERM sorting domain-containing protein [Armatimonadota bacterium]|nr:PEP-CTERM sorting domain-containing protein [Armatimonadota bacterium]
MKKLSVLAVAATFAVSANAQWSDNFDSYAAGTQLHGVGGWTGWGNSVGAGALVSNAQSSSAPNSVDIVGASDLVQEFAGATSGIWMFSGEVFIPTSFTGISWFIMMNTYTSAGGGGGNWSMQQQFDGGTGMILNAGGSNNVVTETQVPFIRGQWVGFDVTIDLDTNTHTGRYNGAQVVTGAWYGAPGVAAIANIDLFANNASSVFYDNLELQVVPEPGTFIALGVGLASLVALRRRK